MFYELMRKLVSSLVFITLTVAFIVVVFKEADRRDNARQEKLTYPVLIEDNPVQQVEPPVDNPVDNVDNAVESAEISSPKYTSGQLEILAIIIYQEAGGDKCSDDTRRKVGSVFLNRVNSPLFPNTFEEVATAKNQYGELCWTGIKWPDRAKYDSEAHAVKRAYAIAEELLVSGSVLPSNVIWQAQFYQGDGVYCYQDGMYFCYSEVSK